MSGSIWGLRPLAREPQTRHFTDPEQPEWEGVTLILAGLDGVRATRCAVLKAELMRRHVTGLRGPDGELEKGPDGKALSPPEPVRCQDFSRRVPDEVVIDRYAKMASMWAGEEPCPPLSEVLGWQALLYTGWLDIANWIEEVYARGLEGNSGNPSGPPTAASSEPSLTSTESTPSSPPEETHCSIPSNGASGLLPSPSAAPPPATPDLMAARVLRD
jgi:hypothetical protein